MKKIAALIRRNLLEMLRDPLSVVFCIAFPVVMLVFLQVMFQGIPVVPENFQIENYAVGICVFGYTFTGMFLAMSIAGDKNTSLIRRIEVSPVNRWAYLISFLLSGLPVALLQTLLFFAIALPFGFPLDGRLPLAVLRLFPSAVFYLSLGVLLGNICKNEKQTGPINSIVVSITGMLGGVFMPVGIFTGGFKTFINILPFTHTVQIAGVLYGNGGGWVHLLAVSLYSLGLWGSILLVEKLRVK